MQKLVGVEVFREWVPIGKTLMWSLVKEGRLETVKIGRRTLITVESIERLINQSSSQGEVR